MRQNYDMKNLLFTWCIFIPLLVLIAMIEIWWEQETGYSFPAVLNIIIGACLFGSILLVADKIFSDKTN